ncbi:uroplakin-3b-like protein 1 isoform X1 [Oncorhynchus tshawytscha]|uniref:uroplakin-3b-like protein 1 isoform X1 n=1 Tax=Oncorhynchus tshawytscha TaxID=74940 RepID=UPI000D09DC2F|nr:uroplakin-3b-like protein 1 isoform X1 [Oncorhynchus tshawytscha]
MAGSSAPVMYWAVLATLYCVLCSGALQFLYQAVMQPVKMLSMVQLYNFFEDLMGAVLDWLFIQPSSSFTRHTQNVCWNISVPVNNTPAINPSNLAAKLTTNSVILTSPSCYFDSLANLPCNSTTTCELWLVSAIDTGVNNFDADKNRSNIDTLSPYPTAFSSNTSKKYFLTKLGLQKDYPCPIAAGTDYFRVGSDGSCSTPNCNGILPVGSTARFRYVLINPENKTVVAESLWSNNITLYTLKDLESIDNGFAGRSASMIVITSILCSFLALLLLLLLIMLFYVLCCRKEKQEIQVPGSVRMYDTHNLKEPSPYVNRAYEDEPHRPTATSPIRLKSYTDYDLKKPATEL